MPLTAKQYPWHKKLGITYIFVQIILFLSGFYLKNLEVPFSNYGIHGIMHNLVRNFSIITFSLLSISTILNRTKGSKQKLAIFILSLVTLILGVVVGGYGILGATLTPAINLSEHILPILGFYPSYVIFGIFISFIAAKSIREFFNEDKARVDVIKHHRRVMAAMLIISLNNFITVESNKLDLLNNEWYFLISILFAVLLYIVYPYRQKALKITDNDKLLSGFLLVFVLCYAIWFYGLKVEKSNYWVYSVKVVQVDEEAAPKSVQNINDTAKSLNCVFVLKSQSEETKGRFFFRVTKCPDIASMEKMLEVLSSGKAENDQKDFNFTLTGAGPNRKKQILDPGTNIIFVNYFLKGINQRASVNEALNENSCRRLIYFQPIKYTNYHSQNVVTEIYKCFSKTENELEPIKETFKEISNDNVAFYYTQVVTKPVLSK